MKVPTPKDRKKQHEINKQILNILKDGAAKELESQFITDDRRKLLHYLINKKDISGTGCFKYWKPTPETLSILRKEQIIEDELILGDFYFKETCDEALSIIKDDIQNLKSQGKFLPQFDNVHFEYLENLKEFNGDLPSIAPPDSSISKLLEQRLIESEHNLVGYYDGLERWLLTNAKSHIKSGHLSPLIEFFQNDKFPIDSLFPDIADYENVFYKVGDIWLIKFKARVTAVKMHERINLIIPLLERPYDSISAEDLHRKAYPHKRGYSYSLDDKSEFFAFEDTENLHIGENDLFTKEDIKSCKQVAIKCWEETGDLDKAKLALEGTGITIYLKNGKPKCSFRKKVPPGKDKIRSNVTIQIKETIESFKEKIPTLHNHLKKCIKTGYDCRYNPPTEIKWFIDKK